MGKVRFDFYYGVEAEQFSFYRVPRLLIQNERFRGLSSDAKLLYGLMLDRMALSCKNGWFDDENRAYIIYTVENMQEDLGCSKPTIVKVMHELDEAGIGLIEKKRRGLGKPDIIYVKNFASMETAQEGEEDPEKPESSTEVKNFNFKKSRNFTSRSQETLPQEVKNVDFKKSKNLTSGGQENLPQEVKKLDPNYTNLSYTDVSYSDPIHPSIPSREQTDEIDEIEAYRQLIRTNIEYDSFMQSCDPAEVEDVREIYGLICEVVCVPRETIRIAGEDYPYEIVKAQYLKLDADDIRYVRHCMQQTTTKIRNIKAYLQTALYNAPNTKGHFYGAMAQHDLYGDGS